MNGSNCSLNIRTFIVCSNIAQCFLCFRNLVNIEQYFIKVQNFKCDVNNWNRSSVAIHQLTKPCKKKLPRNPNGNHQIRRKLKWQCNGYYWPQRILHYGYVGWISVLYESLSLVHNRIADIFSHFFHLWKHYFIFYKFIPCPCSGNTTHHSFDRSKIPHTIWPWPSRKGCDP